MTWTLPPTTLLTNFSFFLWMMNLTQPHQTFLNDVNFFMGVVPYRGDSSAGGITLDSGSQYCGLEVSNEDLMKMTLRMCCWVHSPRKTSYPSSLRKVPGGVGLEPPMPWLHGITTPSNQPQLPHQLSNISPNQTMLLIPHGETFFFVCCKFIGPPAMPAITLSHNK